MIGSAIDQYRIVEELGHGGMGVVFKAEDSRLQRYVAITFLRKTTGSESDLMKRFRQLFLFLLVLDVAWATAPLPLFARIEYVALAGLVGLAYAPFSQRTLMRAAYP